MDEITRRQFLKAGATGAISLCLPYFGSTVCAASVGKALAKGVKYASWEDVYRKQWTWDKVTYGCHSNACTPNNCPWRVYVRAGVVWREEQVADTQARGSGYPDYSPLGCQKGASFSSIVNGDERLKYPLKRAGARGEGKWRRISWDEAISEIADSIIDAIEQHGSETFVLDSPHFHAGTVGSIGVHRLTRILGGVCPDLNVQIGDVYMGLMQTMGKMHIGYTADNWFDAKLIIITHGNPAYTHIPSCHFYTEARYNGAEVVLVAPDFSPTAPQADIHVPVRVGTDPAFWLGVCQVILTEAHYDAAFVKEQTDLSLLVRDDTRKFLREADLVEGGNEKQLYHYDVKSGAIAKAQRKTLKLEYDPALEGVYTVTLKDGKSVKVETVFSVLKRHLDQDYTPEKAATSCGVPPSAIRTVARKMATKRTCTILGWNSAKSYHGDLAERSLTLAHALTGNLGKPGTGLVQWAFTPDFWEMLMFLDKPPLEGGLAQVEQMGQAFAKKVLAEDPDATDEMVMLDMMSALTTELGVFPPVFYQYYHAGYKELWDKWQGDPLHVKPFSGYVEESIAKGWWNHARHIMIAPEKHPQVIMNIAHNFMRRERSGYDQILNHLLPKTKLLFALEVKISGSALYSDIVLPCATSYEKEDLSFSYLSNPRVAFMEKATNPPGEAKPEWEICTLLLQKIGARATQRGLSVYKDRLSREKSYQGLYDQFTMNGRLETHKQVVTEMITLGAALGIFEKGANYELGAKRGYFEVQSFAKGSFMELTQANELSTDRPSYPLRWHVEDKKPYPTYARRLQFYIDHEWFLAAKEELPIHKAPPDIGGQHPFRITGGHPRHSVHTLHQTNKKLNSLHRGQPVVHINDRTAAGLGIADGDRVRVYNDVSEARLMAKITPAVAPDQVIVYLWDPLMFEGAKSYDNMLVGLPKALQLAGGYEQIGRYYFFNGTPSPTTDRGVRVSVQKV